MVIMDKLPDGVPVQETVPLVSRRTLLFGAALGLVMSGCAGSPREMPAASPATPEIQESPSPTPSIPEYSPQPLTPEQEREAFLQKVAESLLEQHEESNGGWRFQSEIQSPHYQTDRDVGASSVGITFLQLAERYPDDKRWLDAATKTATWLKSVSVEDGRGGRYWPDYADDGGASDQAYTSFDDGAIGVGDFFWRLYEKTSDEGHKKVALESVRWTMSQAEKTRGGGLRWKWDAHDSESSYQMGMGEGVVGIVHTLATYYERTKQADPAFAAECKKYIDGALIYIKTARQALGQNDGDSDALPETGVSNQDGGTSMNSGYLSGAAGAAYMYLKLEAVFGGGGYRKEANQLLKWLQKPGSGPMVRRANDQVAWKLMVDPQGGDNPVFATGVEEGSAGIGGVFLEAYKQTQDPEYLKVAKQAANWLQAVALRDSSGGWSWHENERGSTSNPDYPESSIVHPNLNNGAAGIGAFLRDIYNATNDQRYLLGAEGAEKYLTASAVTDATGTYWRDNDEGSPFKQDPSWHWGAAGILAFYLWRDGGTSMLGNQDKLRK